MSDICLSCSLHGFYVDVALGGLRSEGPQCFFSDPTHTTELQQGDLRQYEHSGCVQMGKHNSAEQPVWGAPRSV